MVYSDEIFMTLPIPRWRRRLANWLTRGRLADLEFNVEQLDRAAGRMQAELRSLRNSIRRSPQIDRREGPAEARIALIRRTADGTVIARHVDEREVLFVQSGLHFKVNQDGSYTLTNPSGHTVSVTVAHRKEG